MTEAPGLATVDPIDGGDWSAKAAAGDAMQRAGHRDAIVCIWLDEEGAVRYSKANTSTRDLCTLAAFLMHMATYPWREED